MSHPEPALTIVTGAASGIGRSVVEALIAQGKPVLALDKNREALAELASLHPDDQLLCRPVNLHEGASIDAQLAQALESKPPLQGLVHCAGVWAGGTILDTSDETWAHLLQNNLLAAKNICARIAPIMMRAREGSIVIVSSNAARLPRLDMSAYCVSKAALSMYARCLALQLAPHQVRCNVVSPGATQTPMQASYQKYMESAAIDHRFRIPAPLEGSSQPDDIAQVISFLLSDAASSVTLADLSADRGATLGV